jgi:hypothetical protein
MCVVKNNSMLGTSLGTERRFYFLFLGFWFDVCGQFAVE